MWKLIEREISATSGRCVRCTQQATLTVHERRYVRGWRGLLARDFDPAVTRTASCSACATTYPVRSTDRTPAGAARRRGDSHAEPVARDWRRTPVQV